MSVTLCRCLPLLLICLSVGLSAGCVSKGRLGGDTATQPVAADAWWPKPVAVEVFPSTRFVRENGDIILEARVQLTDELGDSIKAPSAFYIDLFAGPVGEAAPRRLYSWQVNVWTLEDQIEFFDPVTRAYLFRLRVADISQVRDTAQLSIVVLPEGGERLNATARISRRR